MKTWVSVSSFLFLLELGFILEKKGGSVTKFTCELCYVLVTALGFTIVNNCGLKQDLTKGSGRSDI